MPVSIPKTYKYKVFNKDRNYLGYLNNVVSDFSYSQDINTTACQSLIEVNASADVSSIPVEPIEDEVYDDILDEQNNIVYEERAQDIVGTTNPNALIQENNIIEVYEFDELEPNGRLVFDGYIQEWKAVFNGGSGQDRIEFTLVSRSIDLQDYVLSGGNTTIDSNTSSGSYESGNIYGLYAIQKIRFGSNTDLGQIAITVENPSLSLTAQYKVYVYKGDPTLDRVDVNFGFPTYVAGTGNTLIANGTAVTLETETTKVKRTSTLIEKGLVIIFPLGFTSSRNITFFGGQDYYVVVEIPLTNNLARLYYGTNPGGNFKEYYYIAGTFASGSYYPTLRASSAMTIDLIQIGGNTTTTYTSTDPSNMIKQTIDNYGGQGGVVFYDDDTIDLTGESLSYTFVVATILEAIKRIKSFSPSDFYYYVNPATNMFYFKQTATTPHHLFIKGRHLEQLEISATVENVVNEIYFTGGLVGSTNLFKRYTNPISITEQGRRRLQLRTDNRVTLSATADSIASALLDQNSTSVYSSPVSILTSTYDTSTINVGDIVKIEGFGNFVDYLLLQVARIRRSPDRVDLTLGVILKRQADILNETLDDVTAIQTIDNPTTPS